MSEEEDYDYEIDELDTELVTVDEVEAKLLKRKKKSPYENKEQYIQMIKKESANYDPHRVKKESPVIFVDRELKKDGFSEIYSKLNRNK
jgi:hypothetical protein